MTHKTGIERGNLGFKGPKVEGAFRDSYLSIRPYMGDKGYINVDMRVYTGLEDEERKSFRYGFDVAEAHSLVLDIEDAANAEAGFKRILPVKTMDQGVVVPNGTVEIGKDANGIVYIGCRSNAKVNLSVKFEIMPNVDFHGMTDPETGESVDRGVLSVRRARTFAKIYHPYMVAAIQSLSDANKDISPQNPLSAQEGGGYNKGNSSWGNRGQRQGWSNSRAANNSRYNNGGNGGNGGGGYNNRPTNPAANPSAGSGSIEPAGATSQATEAPAPQAANGGFEMNV